MFKQFRVLHISQHVYIVILKKNSFISYAYIEFSILNDNE